MSANTSRVIWKGERPQKSQITCLIPKAKDTSVQKTVYSCFNQDSVYIHVYIYICFTALLIAATFWQASPYHETIRSSSSPNFCRTFTSLTAITKRCISQELVKSIFAYVETGCMEVLGQVKSREYFWSIQGLTFLCSSKFSLHKQKQVFYMFTDKC